MTWDPRTKSKTAPDDGRDDDYLTKNFEPIMVMFDLGRHIFKLIVNIPIQYKVKTASDDGDDMMRIKRSSGTITLFGGG